MTTKKLNGEVFACGWTTCAMCDKRIRYMLRPELALVMIQQDELCFDCLKQEFDDDMDWDLGYARGLA